MPYKKIHVFRVKPDQDLLESIEDYCKNNQIISGVIIGMIGSLKIASINYLKSLPANYVNRKYQGPMEIVCSQGTIAKSGEDTIVHLHLVIDNEKETRGGHLAKGSIVFSTAEVVIGELKEQITRKKDDYTGLLEIQ
jgi:predicted DNA-binding protein with PD1-like motif